jgi:hypothetical protein
MGRRVAVVGLLMMLVACGGAGWMATRPPVGQFLVPGATDIQVTALGWNEWQINYRAPDVPTSWFTAIGRHLEAQRWSSPDSVGYGALSRSYSRASSLGCCALWEWAFLSFDPARPDVAQIRMRRWIAIPWWWRVSQIATTPENEDGGMLAGDPLARSVPPNDSPIGSRRSGRRYCCVQNNIFTKVAVPILPVVFAISTPGPLDAP